MQHVYLDHAATTPVDEEVAAAMVEAMTVHYGNPSSAHRLGLEAGRRLDSARAQVAHAIGARPRDVYFTSGGTEANAIGILGMAGARGGHLVWSALEHPSVADAMKRLGERGFTLTEVRPGPDGVVAPETLAEAVREDTVLVALMCVSNELGTVQPVVEAARAVKRRAPRARFHVDAVQALGKLPIDALEWAAAGIDSIAVSAHKIHGPKGAGAVWLRPGGVTASFASLTVGGGQEHGVRPGTQGVPGAIGLGIAAERAAAARATIVPRMTALRARMIDRARAIFPRLLVHGEPTGAPTPSTNASPHIVSLGFPGVPAEPLLHALEGRGVFVSAGSACAAKDKKPSAALRAIGVPDDVGTIRVSLSGRSTEAEIDTAAEVLRAALADLTQLPARSRR